MLIFNWKQLRSLLPLKRLSQFLILLTQIKIGK